MPAQRLRTDLSHVVSWLLLASAATTIVTGIVADAWDLNGFRLHTVAGYVMTVAALAHVALSWRRLMFYARFRFRHLRRRPAVHATPDVRGRPDAPAVGGSAGGGTSAPRPATAQVTRRGLLGATAAAATGFVAGRGLRPPPAIPQGSDVGLVYHEWSKPGVTDALGTLVRWGGKPPLYKRYEDAPFVSLPDATPTTDVTLPEALQRRHSIREYADTPLPIDALSTLVAHADGLREGDRDRRVAPSSGALYPIEVYPVVNRVDGLSPGIYHYDLRRHGLSRVHDEPAGATVMRYGLDQDFLASANVVFVLTMILQRMRFKYRDRSYRYGLLEAGHIGQNLCLTATAIGLGSCPVGAFHDDGLNALLGVDGRKEMAVYMVATGLPTA